jgi:hypothetical protein
MIIPTNTYSKSRLSPSARSDNFVVTKNEDLNDMHLYVARCFAKLRPEPPVLRDSILPSKCLGSKHNQEPDFGLFLAAHTNDLHAAKLRIWANSLWMLLPHLVVITAITLKSM